MTHPWLRAAFVAVLTLLAPLAEGAPISVCFAPGTPQDVMEQRLADAELSWARTATAPQSAVAGLGWQATATDGAGLVRGEPIVLTWHVVADGTSIVGGLDEGDGPSDLRAFLDSLYGSEAKWKPLLQQALESWGARVGVHFVEEANDDGQFVGVASSAGVTGVRADVRIAGHAIDGDYATVAYAWEPDGGELVIDTYDSFFDDTSNDSLSLRNTVAHEIGHAIGLGHVWPVDSTKLMEPTISAFFDGPQFDDVIGATRNYGDLDEPNDTPGSPAGDLGLTAPGSVDVLWLSLDGSGDEDWFAVVGAPAGARLSASVAPRGASYQMSATACTVVAKDCPSFDAAAQRDLAVDVYSSDGSTLLASADIEGLGVGESLLNVALPDGAGFVAVAGDVADVAQLYDLQVSLVPEPAARLLGASALLALAALGRRRPSPAARRAAAGDPS